MAIPAVSILLPVRNEQEFLPAALASLFRQSLTDWEIIAIDDGSIDRTSGILAEAAFRENRLRIVPFKGRGLVAALNAGLGACSAPQVARMDADDICHPRRLELQKAYLDANPHVGLVTSKFNHFPRSGLRVGMLSYETWQNSLTDHSAIIRDIFVESPFVHPSVMFRKAAVEKVGGYRDMGWAEDYDLWLRLAAAGTIFARLPRLLFFWRDRPCRATRTMIEYSAEAFRECKLYHLRQGFLKDVDEVILAGAGIEGRHWRAALKHAGVKVVLWVDVDPRKIGRILHDAPVVAPDVVKGGDGKKMLITVGTRGAREGIRSWAAGAGFTEGSDFICVT